MMSLTLYAKAALGGLRRSAGNRFPDVELTSSAKVDRDHLATYSRVCGFPIADRLPATYPHILAFPLALRLFVRPDFPFPAMGLMHIANRITTTRPLDAGEELFFAVRIKNPREHRRGTQFDVLTEAGTAEGVAWSSHSTYLAKGKPPAPPSGEEPCVSPTDESATNVSARWRIAGDIGRRYAAVSGDPNPIHLTALSARAFGFKRPIAHGMWLAARCLAAFEGRLPDTLNYEISFLRPVLVPSSADFAESTAQRVFELRRALPRQSTQVPDDGDEAPAKVLLRGSIGPA